MANGTAQSLIPKLTKDNYDLWSIQMRALLGTQDVMEIVEDGYNEPESKEAETALKEDQKTILYTERKKDCKARSIIYQGLDEATFAIIFSATTSKEIWETLQKTYRGADKVKRIRLQTLRCEFESLRMKPSESISDYYARIISISNQMRRNGEFLTDLRIIEKILRSLDCRFNFIVVTWEELKEVRTMSLEELVGSLQAHEQKLYRDDDKTPEHALQTKLSLNDKRHEQGGTFQRGRGRDSRNSNSRGRSGRGQYRGGQQNHGQQNYVQRGGGQPQQQQSQQGGGRGYRGAGRGRRGGFYNRPNVDKSNIQCYNCYKYGHYSNECRGKQAINQVGETSNYADKDPVAEDSLSLMAHSSNREDHGIWYLDSGASNHMAGTRQLFTDLDENIKGEISFGDLSKVPVKGRGDIVLKRKNGDHAFISNVYYVPDMKTNILSLGQLLEKGYQISLKDMHLTLADTRGKLITRVRMAKNMMFPLTILHDTPKCLNSILNDKDWLWHLRYGHLNFESLKLLSRNKMVKGLPHIQHPNEVCENCVLGK